MFASGKRRPRLVASATRYLQQTRRQLCAVPKGVPLPATIESMLRARWSDLDPDAPAILDVLQSSDAPLIWHKHSSFLDHLREVWAMLVNWGQPQAVCRLGLLHSAYSNSFVSMNCFNPKSDRPAVANLIGDEAENLVYKFCSIDRQALEEQVLRERTVQRDGYKLRHIHTGEPLAVSGAEAAAFVTETLADELDQRFGWQSDLEHGATNACWPGPAPPTLRLARTCQLGVALRTSGLVEEARLPPIFERCSAIIESASEAAARDAYWRAATVGGVIPAESATCVAQQIADLVDASRLNRFVAEPHIARAQCLLQLQRWEEAEVAAQRGVELLCINGTQWDKRMPFNAWVNWARCLALQAQFREWPTTHGGLESLGATMPRMRFRRLNHDRSLTMATTIVR